MQAAGLGYRCRALVTGGWPWMQAVGLVYRGRPWIQASGLGYRRLALRDVSRIATRSPTIIYGCVPTMSAFILFYCPTRYSLSIVVGFKLNNPPPPPHALFLGQ